MNARSPCGVSLCCVLVSLAVGCELPVGDGTGTATAFAEGDWSVSTHPCVGNRTDVLWFDDADRGYVGCGSTTVGYGAFVTKDGGSTWSELSNRLAAFRNQIQPAPYGPWAAPTSPAPSDAGVAQPRRPATTRCRRPPPPHTR